MQSYLDEIKDISDYLPGILSLFAILWAGFAFLDYIYEQCYCRYFNIASLVKKEYKSAFHPKYIIDILLYAFIVIAWSMCIDHIGLNQGCIAIIVILLLSIIVFYIIDTIAVQYLNIIEKSEYVSKEAGENYRKMQKFQYITVKINAELFVFLLIGVPIQFANKNPLIATIIVCIGLIIFYGIKNDAFVCWFSQFMRNNVLTTYTMDHFNVITNDDKQYAVLLPNSRITNDHIVACRILLMKTNNNSTYILFNTHETKVFDYNEKLDVIRYEPDLYLRISHDDGYDSFDDEAMALSVKITEKPKGRMVDFYYKGAEWIRIDEIKPKHKNMDTDRVKQEVDENSDSEDSKEPGNNHINKNRKKRSH